MAEFNKLYYDAKGLASDRPSLWFYCRLAKSYFMPGRILDFGCGTGFLLKKLNRHFEADGYDLSEYACSMARSLLPSVKIFNSIEEIPNHTYTGIISLHVLEHIDDIQLHAVLAKWKAALVHKGRVISVVPELHGKGHRIKGNDWFAFGDTSHINLKTAEEWKRLFISNGFTINRIGTDGLWDFPYTRAVPKIIDALIHSKGTIAQYLMGKLLLSVGKGESAIFLLEADKG